MYGLVALGLLIPFIGTSLGAFMVFFMKGELSEKLQKQLTGFAAGVMVAASFFSLLLPAIEQSEETMGKLAFLPSSIGFILGMVFLLVLDMVIPHMHLDNTVEGPNSKIRKTTMLVLAVVIHNIPEGMAVGVVYAGWLQGDKLITLAAAFSLAIGIAIQNFPEGAIVSMPLHAQGVSKKKACLQGVLSGIVEPIGGLITILLSALIVPYMPYLLAFAAGAMIYVVVEELVPEMSGGEHSNMATMAFMVGFVVMMILDVALG